MADEVFWDTSGFFALLDLNDAARQRALDWVGSSEGHRRAVTTEWVIGETCTLLVARKRGHLVSAFLDHLERTAALTVINPDETLLSEAKRMIRKQTTQGYSFTDCISFSLMRERRIREALTADAHFLQAGFLPLLHP
jgi:predicted nucleic acid-binding protein